MEREFGGGGSDYGRDIERDMGDAPPEAIRDSAPDILSPIDERSPVSGHSSPQRVPGAAALSRAPENDFAAAAALIVPALRPVGTHGQPVGELGRGSPDPSSQAHTRPLLDEGPCGLPVVYTMAAEGFDVLVNGDHLASWGVGVAEVQDAAIANLAAWSAQAPWTDEVSGNRRLVSSDTGDGNDAARILLPEVRDHLAGELGGDGRVLIGLPARHAPLAGALREGDEEFAELF